MLEPDDREDWRVPLKEGLEYEQTALSDLSLWINSYNSQCSKLETEIRNIYSNMHTIIQSFMKIIRKLPAYSNTSQNDLDNLNIIPQISNYITQHLISEENRSELSEIKDFASGMLNVLNIYQQTYSNSNIFGKSLLITCTHIKKLLVSNLESVSQQQTPSITDYIKKSLYLRISSLYETQRLCIESLSLLTCNYEFQQMELLFPSPSVLAGFDLFQRLAGNHSKLITLFKKKLYEIRRFLPEIEDIIDTIGYNSDELKEFITTQTDSILTENAKLLSIFKRLTSESRLFNNQLCILNDYQDIDLQNIDNTDISLKDHYSILNQTLEIAKRNTDIIRNVNLHLDHEINYDGKSNPDFYNLTARFVNELNTTRTYAHEIATVLSDFKSAISFELFSPHLFSEHAIMMISVEMPSLLQMNEKIQHLIDLIQQKQSDLESMKRQAEGLRTQTYLYDCTKERIKNPKICSNCLLNPVFVPQCGHVMCPTCFHTSNGICPICGQPINDFIKINWEADFSFRR